MRYRHVEYYLERYTSEGGHVLEIGCGAADYRDMLPADSYVATDVKNEHYQRAQSVDVFCDAGNLPFPDNSFDLAFSQSAIDYMEDIHSVIAELHRIIKPGGKVLTFTYDQKTLARIHDDAQGGSHPAHIHHHVYNSGQFLAWFRLAGFQCTKLPSDMPLPSAWWKRAILKTPPFPFIRNARSMWRTFLAVKPEAVA